MASGACAARLQKELRQLSKNPLPGLRALPSPSNLLEWHYVIEGQVDSDYAGGFYHGKITFPSSYPFKPPSIQMLTPSGRFEPGAKICLSMSDYHPELWNPLWSVSHILLGLQSFMTENASTTGALHNVPAKTKRIMAQQSLAYSVRNPNFRKLFPELVELHEERMKSAAAEAALAGVQPAPDAAAQDAAMEEREAHVFGGLSWLMLGAIAVAMAAVTAAALLSPDYDFD